MTVIALTDPMPKQEEIDLLGIEWRTMVMIRYGLDPMEAYRLALGLAGFEARAMQQAERMLARGYRP